MLLSCCRGDNNIKVLVRCRPFNDTEATAGSTCCIEVRCSRCSLICGQDEGEDNISLKSGEEPLRFKFDNFFGEESSQEVLTLARWT